MEFYHYYYYLSTALCLALPVWFYFRTKDLASFGVLFPAFYAIYSFVAPLAMIWGAGLDEISRSYLVWDKIFTFADKPYFYLGHTYFTLFFIFWFVAFLLGRGRLERAAPRMDTKVFNITNLPRAWILFAVVSLLAAAFFYIVLQRYGSLLKAGISVYAAKATRNPDYQLSTLDKGLFSLWGSALLCYGTLILLQFKQWRRWPRLFSAVTLLGHMGLYLLAGFIIGDRSQLIIPLVGMFVVYNLIYKRLTIFSAGFLSILAAGMMANFFISSFRQQDPSQAIQSLATDGRVNTKVVVAKTLFSVESFAAYTGMPYLIVNDVPPLYGESVGHFALSFLPRVIAPYRIMGSYSYRRYAIYAGVFDSGQGFTFHYVADWYFNFWVFGIVIGGLVTGYAMGLVEKKAKFSRPSLFWIAAFALLCGAIPSHLRSPIEGVRAVFYEYWSLPFLFFVLIPFVKKRITRPEKKMLAKEALPCVS